jgi:predicted nucleotide-binding protein
MAKLGRHNVCALLKDSVEKPSDYDGVIYISMDTNGAWKQELVKELKDAGINGNFAKLYS